MNRVLIAAMGVEGGGVTIYRSHSQGVWKFWTEGTLIDLDENEDEVWSSWSSNPVSRLDDVLPKQWPVFHPVKIHPDFLDWFRAEYDKVRTSLFGDQRRYQEEHRHARWLEILGIPR
jgi:hypothetical protein